MAAHKHAEVIKAWAGGAQVQYFDTISGTWIDTEGPNWAPERQYRIKPAEPAREYPVTQMTGDTLHEYYMSHDGHTEDSLVIVANKALSYAIDAGQVVTREEFDKLAAEHKEAIESLSHARKELLRVSEEREARDMAVAKAVLDDVVEDLYLEFDLPAIIAGVGK